MKLRVIEWADAPPKGDAADVPGGAEGIRALVAAARPYVLNENQKSTVGGAASGPLAPSARTVRLSDVAARPVKWLLPGRIPRGKVAVVDGDPGLGKSTLMLEIAARVTTGSPMPDGSRSDLDGPASVVLLSAEDGLDDTIRPRLDAAGADTRRVVALVGVSDGDPDRPERLPTLDDIVEIETAVRANDAALVIVDPLMAYLPGRADSSKDQDVRSVLARLARVAEDTGAAIVVVRHLNKSQQASALYRGGGSIGIIGAARSGLLVARDPDDPTGARRILAMTKSNLAAPMPALAYRLIPDENGAVRVAWEGETDHTADGLLAQPSSPEERTATDEAVEWLEAALRGGERPASDVQLEARRDGITDKCLRLARQRLGLVSRRDGFGPGSRRMWSLRSETAESPAPPVGRSSIDALAPPLMPDVSTRVRGASMAAEGIYGARENGVAAMHVVPSDADVATSERPDAPDDEWGEI
jgi:hypothetical protein